MEFSRGECNAGDLAAGAEGDIACGTVLVGGQAVAVELELEVVLDSAVGGEEALRVPGRLEPLHLPLSSSCRLVRHLGPVVQGAALPVLDTGQDLTLCRSVAPERVGHDHPRDVLQALSSVWKHRLAATPALHQDVERVSMLVDRSPKRVPLAADAEEHLIEMSYQVPQLLTLM